MLYHGSRLLWQERGLLCSVPLSYPPLPWDSVARRSSWLPSSILDSQPPELRQVTSTLSSLPVSGALLQQQNIDQDSNTDLLVPAGYSGY